MDSTSGLATASRGTGALGSCFSASAATPHGQTGRPTGRPAFQRTLAGAMALLLGGCSTVSSLGSDFLGGKPAPGTPGYVSGFLGGVVADEPRAALAARDVLSAGGNAADAAVALGFRARGHLAVPRGPRQRRRVHGAGAVAEIRQWRSSRGDPVHAAGGRNRCGRIRPARRSADAGARPVRPARALRPSSLRDAHRPRRADGPVRRAGLARPGPRPAGRLRAALRRPSGALRLLAWRRAARGGRPAPAAGSRRDAGAAPRLGRGRLLPGEPGRADRERIASRRRRAERLRFARGAAPAGASAHDRERPRPRLLRAAARRWRAGRRCRLATLDERPEAVAEAGARALAVAARWRAGGGDPQALLRASLPPASLPPLPASTTFVDAGPRGRRGRLRADARQSVRDGKAAAGPGLPARRLARRRAAAAARGRDRLERAPARLPRRRRRLRAGGGGARRRRRDEERAAVEPADAGAGAGARPGQRDRLQPLSARPGPPAAGRPTRAASASPSDRSSAWRSRSAGAHPLRRSWSWT